MFITAPSVPVSARCPSGHGHPLEGLAAAARPPVFQRLATNTQGRHAHAAPPSATFFGGGAVQQVRNANVWLRLYAIRLHWRARGAF
jgi:hypothetical protein